MSSFMRAIEARPPNGVDFAVVVLKEAQVDFALEFAIVGQGVDVGAFGFAGGAI